MVLEHVFYKERRRPMLGITTVNALVSDNVPQQTFGGTPMPVF
jgi:hypothetical protein